MQGESVVGGGVLGQRAGWVVVNSWSNWGTKTGDCGGVVFQAFLQHPSNFPGEGKFDLRRLEKWWWHVLGCGSVLEGRGGGGGRSWLKMLLRCLLGVFEGCLVDGGLKLESFEVCWEVSSLF